VSMVLGRRTLRSHSRAVCASGFAHSILCISTAGNTVGAPGATAFARALELNTSIKTLDLRSKRGRHCDVQELLLCG
jgi:hypothetical protein